MYDDIMATDMREAKRRGNSRRPRPELADFGERAWPRDHVEAMRQGTNPTQLQAVLVELVWRLVGTSPCRSRARQRA